jgi:hypothetical protein
MAEAAQESSKLNIFISYSRDDLDFADQREASLRLGNYKPRLNIAARLKKGGQF